MSIVNLLNQIRNREIVLPAIQREFVWDTQRIVQLLDSILRGYPIGIVLLWETYEAIQYRNFVQDYRPGTRHTFHDNDAQRKLRLVLDGQQRLQSLYVALYGSYNARYLYFEVLSGRDLDDFSQEKFMFRFGTPATAKVWNEDSIRELALAEEDRTPDFWPEHYVKIEELFKMNVLARQKFRRALGKRLNLSEDDDLRVETNLARFDEVMTKDENILRLSVIDEDRAPGNPERKTEADVLEIFVRINRQGMPLTRSDLIFSMLKLNWKESSEALPEFVERINRGNSFGLTNDFVIRALFAVCDFGTRFDLDLLRTKSNVELMQQNFPKCCNAIESTVDFVIKDCGCANSSLLGGAATLIPFVYYFFHLPKHQIPNKEIPDARKALFVFAFTQPFSRYADSRLGAFIREALRYPPAHGYTWFPVRAAIDWTKHWEHIYAYNEQFIQGNPLLALHLVQQHSGAKVHYKNNAPEIDHIFPRSVLREKDFEQTEIEHFANFWILDKGKNQNKSYKPPREYFADVPDTELKRALISRELLDYRRYRTFLTQRSQAIRDAVAARVGLTEEDLPFD